MKKDKMYKMTMYLCKGSWDINSALCECPAGKGPCASCKHIHCKNIFVTVTKNFCHSYETQVTKLLFVNITNI